MTRPARAKVRAWLPQLSAVVFILLVAAVLAKLWSQSGQLDRQQTAIDRLSGGLETTRAQLEQHGIKPVAPPPQELVTGAAGPPGPGPSDAQVAAAVDVYLAGHPPTASASTEQLTTVVAAYLTLHPPAPGAPASDAQVATAVSAYMAAHPAPSGPPGPSGAPGVGETGPAGPPGQDGAAGSPPAGWSWTDPSGVTYDCAPDGQQPGPHYTCTARPTPSASPSESPSLAQSPPPTAQPTVGMHHAPTHAASPTPPTPTRPSPGPSQPDLPLALSAALWDRRSPYRGI